MTLVITTCTSRKRRPVVDALKMASLPRAHSTDLASLWADRLGEASDLVDAGLLYGGAGFRHAAEVSRALGARFLIVSAGLGLIDSSSKVPPYGCTIISGASDSVLARANDRPAPGDWWRLLAAYSPFASKLEDLAGRGNGLILAALSDAYLDMLSADLLALGQARLARLRLFTRTPLSRVPEALRASVMPYDDRLSGADSRYKGTLGSFANRALRHFAERVLEADDARTAADHAAAVEASLAGWRLPEKAARRRVTDEELMTLMRRHWSETGGSSGRMLRLLRDDLAIACEQGRCKALVDRIRSEPC